MRLRPFLPLMLLLFAATVLAAEVTWDSQFSNTLYNTPKGWSTTQKSGSVMLIPPNPREGEQAAIFITPGGELTGDFKKTLTDFRAQLRGDDKATESPVQTLTAEEGYPVLVVAEQLLDEKGATKQYRCFFASNPGTRVEFVILMANSKQAYEHYSPIFEEFVKTVSYKNVRAGAHPTSGPSTQPAPK